MRGRQMTGSADQSEECRICVRITVNVQFADAHLEVLGNLADEALEGELPDEQLGRLLVPPDLTKSNGTRPEPVGLLHTTSSSGLRDEQQ